MNRIKLLLFLAAALLSCNVYAQYGAYNGYAPQRRGLLNGGHEDAPLSLTIGYVNKDWETDFDGDIYKENLWGEPDKHLHGFQIGLGYTTCTPVGIGLQTGAYFEGYYSYSDAVYDQYGYDHYEEYSMYVPAHVVWRIPLARKSSFTVYGGVAVNWAMYGKFQDDDYVYDYWHDEYVNIGDFDYQFTYGRNGWPKHLNLQAEVGASLRINSLLLKGTYSRGFSDHEFYSKEGHYKTRQNKFSLGIGIAF